MRRISSRMTFINKRIIPICLFGFLALFAALSITFMISSGQIQIFFLLVPAGMAIVGYVILKKFVFDLMDEVWDAGDALIVKNKNEEIHIPISEIINISYSYVTNPQRATLMLRHSSRFGSEVTFSPLLSFIPFKKSPIVTELIERVDAIRKG